MIFALLWGAMMDRAGVRPTVLSAATVTLVPLLVWTLGLRWMERSEA